MRTHATLHQLTGAACQCCHGYRMEYRARDMGLVATVSSALRMLSLPRGQVNSTKFYLLAANLASAQDRVDSRFYRERVCGGLISLGKFDLTD